MIIRDRYKEPTGQKTYAPTGKDIPFQTFNRQEDAYYMLAGMIESELGPEGGELLLRYTIR